VGLDRFNKALSDLVGGLATQSEAFRARWAAHNVRRHYTGTKRIRHPAVGDIELTFEAIAADRGLTLFVCTAQAGSSSEDALKLLASWSAVEAHIGEDASTRL
jgi:hypothetical protein